MDSFDEWKFKQNILVNGLNAKSISDMDTIPWNNSQIHIPSYYGNYRGILPDKYKGLIGTKHGRYTILNISRKEYRDTGQITWVADCICECGNERQIPACKLFTNEYLSCGCSARKLNQYEIHGDYTIVYYKDTKLILDTIVFNHLRYVSIECRYSHKYSGNKKCIPYPCISVEINYKRFHVPLHKLLLPAPYDYVVDHINRDTLDARYSNLRVIPKEENSMNSTARITKSNDLPLGVHYNTHGNYMAAITYKGKLYTKSFKTLEEAIKYREELVSKYQIYHPIEVEHLILPNGELNPKYPYERYPIEFWRKIGINPFIAYRI